MSRASVSTTALWSRRAAPSGPDNAAPERAPKAWGKDDIVEPLAAAANLPAPMGDLSRATVDQLLDTACSVLPRSPIQLDKRRRSIRRLAEHLSGFEGGTWQARWEASGWETSEEPLASMNPAPTASWRMTSGLSWLVAMRAVVPSVRTLRRDVVSGWLEKTELRVR
ncbi:hypothetical protein [Sinomonas terrae]|uniref:Uncharacterized protein n=1 Tax=Sinomonas terrae TaxID=2908838 RepID=A0ABS9U6X9_9MICC|nr:hypothetical protein [Sinomonas terrae]MCH6472429.1 hypothetical protein [Sinomonas terrae]